MIASKKARKITYTMVQVPVEWQGVWGQVAFQDKGFFQKGGSMISKLSACQTLKVKYLENLMGDFSLI